MKYLRPEEALADIRVLRALTEPLEAVKKRAKRLAALLRRALPEGLSVSLIDGRIDGRRGIASHPGDPDGPGRHPGDSPFPRPPWRKRLRQWETPIIVRVADDQVLLDLRTLDAEEFAEIRDALRIA